MAIIRSNTVYTQNKIKKIEDFPFDKAYFGSPNKLPSTMKLDGPFFITPYIGAASIFAVRPQDLSKYNVPRGIEINRAYDEWNVKLKDTLLQQPLKELHVRLEGSPDIETVTEMASGYIYTVDITPDIKNHIYQSDKMNPVMEFCIDKLDTIDFSNIQKVDIKMTVYSAPARIKDRRTSYTKSLNSSIFEESTIIESDDYYCESFDIERLSSDILLRPADKYYLDNIIEWKMQTILEGYPNKQPPPEEYNKISSYVKNKTPKMLDDTRIIMYNNDQPIGMIIAYQKEQDWFIDDIFLIPEFRHKGIGRIVLENEIASHDQLALWVYKSNIHAISLYESLGFKVEESTEDRQMMRLRKTDIQEVIVKTTISGAPARIQESFIYQEASNKTKVTREKNKIKNDLNVDKNGFGKIIDKETGKTEIVKLTFNHNEPTHVGRKCHDGNIGGLYRPMNINPNDLDRGHGFTKYLHEKNHIIQDLHKMRETIYENDRPVYKFKYTRENDISDEKLVKTFIDKHKKELISIHSKDPEEYLADLHTARKRGFNETIKTLEDMIYDSSKTSSKSTKNNLAIFKKNFKSLSEKDFSNNDRVRSLMIEYKKILENHKINLKLYDNASHGNPNDAEAEKKIIKMMEKQLTDFDTFKKCLINKDIQMNYEKAINEYNNDLKMRILFLRDMKKIDDRNSHISEGFIEYCNKYDDPLDELLNIHNYKTYVESYNLMNSLYSDIDHQIKDLFQEYNITEDIIDDIMNYMILEYFENEEGV